MAVADDLLSAFINNQVDATRFEAALQRYTREELAAMHKDLRRMLAVRNKRMHTKAKKRIDAAFKKVAEKHRRDLSEFGRYQIEAAVEEINAAVGGVEIAVPRTTEAAMAAATNAQVFGAPDSRWWQRQSARTKERFSDLNMCLSNLFGSKGNCHQVPITTDGRVNGSCAALFNALDP